jgi:hypothetical protein
MFCMTKGPLAWIKIAKNACTSWQAALAQDGWLLENLSSYQGRWHEKIWLGFLRDPVVRHTMGLSEFLMRYDLTSILDHPVYAKTVCSVLCDEHTYSVHHMVPYELIQQTNWFVMDHRYFDYEDLVRRFCKNYDVNIPAIPRLNQSPEIAKQIRIKIDQIKQQHPEIRESVMKNYYERDVFLYAHANSTQSRFDT